MTDIGIKIILFVSADMELRSSGAGQIRSDGHIVDVASCTRDALYLAGTHWYDCIIVDTRLPDGGTDFWGRLRAGGRTPLILVSRQDADVALAAETGCCFIQYPYKPKEPLRSVRTQIRR